MVPASKTVRAAAAGPSPGAGSGPGTGTQVRWCSDACRRAGVSPTDTALEQSIRSLLGTRAGTICPSEAARAVGGEDWRPLMEPARAAARRLVAAGEVEITQAGAVVDPSTAKGPIRIRRAADRPRPPRRPTPLTSRQRTPANDGQRTTGAERRAPAGRRQYAANPYHSWW